MKIMKNKRYATVIDMVRDTSNDPEFVRQLEEHLNARDLVVNLTAKRAARGWTAKELAERAGVSHQAITGMERRKDQDLKLGLLLAVAKALEVEIQVTLNPDAAKAPHQISYKITKQSRPSR